MILGAGSNRKRMIQWAEHYTIVDSPFKGGFTLEIPTLNLDWHFEAEVLWPYSKWHSLFRLQSISGLRDDRIFNIEWNESYDKYSFYYNNDYHAFSGQFPIGNKDKQFTVLHCSANGFSYGSDSVTKANQYSLQQWQSINTIVSQGNIVSIKYYRLYYNSTDYIDIKPIYHRGAYHAGYYLNGKYVLSKSVVELIEA